jgi:hypothetical protein
MRSLKQMHLESLNLTLDSQSRKGDEWEGVYLAHKDVKSVKKTKSQSQGLTKVYLKTSRKSNRYAFWGRPDSVTGLTRECGQVRLIALVGQSQRATIS